MVRGRSLSGRRPGLRAGAPAAALAFTLALAGCADLTSAFSPATSLTVARGAVVVAGPRGYCIDRRLTRTGEGESFVVMGACSAFPFGTDNPVGQAAVLTATVGGEVTTGAFDPDVVEGFLRSAQGRATLSRSGRAETVDIRQVRQDPAVLSLMIRDTTAVGEGPPVDPTYWRAIFLVRGHLVTATVMAFHDSPLSMDQGFFTLADFVNRIRAANPGG